MVKEMDLVIFELANSSATLFNDIAEPPAEEKPHRVPTVASQSYARFWCVVCSSA